jgi:hypothetical protein
MSLISLFAFSILLCSIHCVLPAEAAQVSGHHHHSTDTDQDHKLCGILCSGVTPSTLATLLLIKLMLVALALILDADIRGRDRWLFWAQPRAPPHKS